jgi:hypothetical protein
MTFPKALPPNEPPKVDPPTLEALAKEDVAPPRLPKPLEVDAGAAGFDAKEDNLLPVAAPKEDNLLPVAAPKEELVVGLAAAANGEAVELANAPKPELLKACDEVCDWSFVDASGDFVEDLGAIVAKGDAADVLEKPLPGDIWGVVSPVLCI